MENFSWQITLLCTKSQETKLESFLRGLKGRKSWKLITLTSVFNKLWSIHRQAPNTQHPHKLSLYQIHQRGAGQSYPLIQTSWSNPGLQTENLEATNNHRLPCWIWTCNKFDCEFWPSWSLANFFKHADCTWLQRQHLRRATKNSICQRWSATKRNPIFIRQILIIGQQYQCNHLHFILN